MHPRRPPPPRSRSGTLSCRLLPPPSQGALERERRDRPPPPPLLRDQLLRLREAPLRPQQRPRRAQPRRPLGHRRGALAEAPRALLVAPPGRGARQPPKPRRARPDAPPALPAAGAPAARGRVGRVHRVCVHVPARPRADAPQHADDRPGLLGGVGHRRQDSQDGGDPRRAPQPSLARRAGQTPQALPPLSGASSPTHAAAGLYRGMGATLLGVGPSLAINFGVYETLSAKWRRATHHPGPPSPKLHRRTLPAAPGARCRLAARRGGRSLSAAPPSLARAPQANRARGESCGGEPRRRERRRALLRHHLLPA